MSRPDLCFDTSSLRKSLSSRCRFSIASSTVKRGRTPRNSATSPRHGFRSTMIVGRFDSRASSTAQLTATVVVPAPPLAPRNTCVTHGWLRAGVRRLAPRGGLPHRAVERLLHRARRLRLPARRPGEELVGAGAHRLRIRSGSAAAAIAKIATPPWVARSRSMAAMPDEASARRSTTATSGAMPSARPSTMPREPRRRAAASRPAV